MRPTRKTHSNSTSIVSAIGNISYQVERECICILRDSPIAVECVMHDQNLASECRPTSVFVVRPPESRGRMWLIADLLFREHTLQERGRECAQTKWLRFGRRHQFINHSLRHGTRELLWRCLCKSHFARALIAHHKCTELFNASPIHFEALPSKVFYLVWRQIKNWNLLIQK